jgi:hypothetical protein
MLPNTPFSASSRARSRTLLVAASALVLVLAGSAAPALAASGTVADPASGRTYYSSKTPYEPQQSPAELQTAPAGFLPVYTESVARHGSRALSSFKYDSLTTQIWEQARSEGALTELGTTLGPEVQKLTAANQKLGYGNLTGQGATQHRGIGSRVVERLPSLFAGIDAGTDTVAVESSGEARATASGKAFEQGLEQADPLISSHLPAAIAKRPDTLYFHKAAINADYQEYADSAKVSDAVDAIYAQPRSHEAAREVLERVYTPAFVDRLAAGAYHFVDGGDGKTTVDNEVDAAMMLYNLYIIAPDMTEEVQVDFDRYFAGTDAEWFAYLLDSDDFYGKGPAFAGSDITYKMATPLLTDFLDSIDARLAGSTTAATFRFAHAETIIPFAALIGLPGSTQPVTPDAPYSYATNAWRGETVTPMAANIQWDVYRDASGRAIVRMLYNEREIAFRASCTPIAPGSHFYDVSEVRRCITGQVADASVTPPSAISDPALPVAVGTGGAATLAATGEDATERDLLIGLALALLTAGVGAIAVRSARARRTRLTSASVHGHDVITLAGSQRGTFG